jgi:hypothetical protein
MILHAELLTPGWLSTTSLIEMAFFRMDDTRIALSQFLETRIAMALIETLITFPSTVNAINHPAVQQLDFLAYVRIQRNIFLTKTNTIIYRLLESATHLA